MLVSTASCQAEGGSSDVSEAPRTIIPNQLCTTCTSINFASLGHPSHERSTASGFTLSPTRSPTCAICQLLEHSLDRSGERAEQGILRGTYDGRELQIYIENRRLEYSIQRCEQSLEAQTNQSVHVSKRFDPCELTRWLKECESHQCLPQNHSDSRCHLPQNFRVVDVIERRIVHCETFVRYCALSYVWGSRNQRFLQKNSQHELALEGRIDRLEELPQTIIDAMNLCRDIGCRYLWVDSLCIIQDCDEDRHSQIRSMADIYSQSYLCIIAATGEDANSGLRPYGRFGRQQPIETAVTQISGLGGFVATLSPQFAAEGIARSVWASRGWTLQEQALSRRVLFFAGTYTFFRCERSLWGEDFGLGFSNLFDRIQRWDLPMPPFYRRKSVDGHVYSNTFKQMLGEYLRRQKNLRYEEDILNAITGVLIRMKDDIGDHLWGLPSKRLSVALQWRSTEESFAGEQRPGFPSWSWAGWRHGLYDSSFDIYEGVDTESRNQSAISCWVMEGRMFREIEQIQVHVVATQLRKAMFDDRRPKACNGTSEHDLSALASFVASPNAVLDLLRGWQSPLETPISQHLFIWASCAKFHVDRVELDDGELVCVHLDGNRLGKVELNTRYRVKAGDSIECFVTTVGMYSMEVKVRVLLIKLVYKAGSLSPPIYRRVQALDTSVSLRDWVSYRPENRLIVLV
ncbi:heterokaryon incompatibility protein-domain-containing protein [Lophiotrema nucula]|uniref:Heterokaryon incompatibility protein-domain-containing protein n=1 Tax=Lophiotrema nucula TaxID=690887 RepID=A0A6A5YU86_9PLEO|nr:heterokaryon incompatibility protein-domain-containing protein [Lophiotrema nucula]